MIQQNKEINYSKIADKETQSQILEAISKLSNEDQKIILNYVNQTTLNTNEKVTALDTNLTQMSKSISGDGSTNTGYGTGAMGNITYNPNTTIWPQQDAYGRYIWNCTDFTLPEGVTMTPPEKNNGLYIYCTGTCTINGTIDVKEKRLTLNGSNGITNYVIIKGNKYYLAKGGHTVKGGDGGYAGRRANTVDSIVTTKYYDGGKALDTVYAGNINGGGTSTYGTGATTYEAGGEFTYRHSYDSNNLGNYFSILPSNGTTSDFLPAPGAIIIGAHNLIIGTNGVLDASCRNGKICGNSTEASITAYQYLRGGDNPSYDTYTTGTCGNGGDGTIAPSGGGPITIIADSFTNNGKILNKGQNITC